MAQGRGEGWMPRACPQAGGKGRERGKEMERVGVGVGVRVRELRKGEGGGRGWRARELGKGFGQGCLWAGQGKVSFCLPRQGLEWATSHLQQVEEVFLP
jgi:hypothetical protein